MAYTITVQINVLHLMINDQCSTLRTVFQALIPIETEIWLDLRPIVSGSNKIQTLMIFIASRVN